MTPEELKHIADAVEDHVTQILTDGLKDQAAIFAEQGEDRVAEVLREVSKRFAERSRVDD